MFIFGLIFFICLQIFNVYKYRGYEKLQKNLKRFTSYFIYKFAIFFN